MTPFIDTAMRDDVTYAIGGMLVELLDSARVLRRLLLAVLLLLSGSVALMFIPSAGDGPETWASVLLGMGIGGVALCAGFAALLAGRIRAVVFLRGREAGLLAETLLSRREEKDEPSSTTDTQSLNRSKQ